MLRKIACFSLLLLLFACKPNNTNNSAISVADAVKPNVQTLQEMDAGAIVEAFGAQRNLPLVQGIGLVKKLLKDDTKGSQHQKFLLQVSNNITILIAHNIDLAPRVADIKEGDTVEYKGEYIYTPKGGTVHWTHKDPRGTHQGGWLKHNGKTYE